MSLASEIKVYLEEQASLNLPQPWEIPISQVRGMAHARVGLGGESEAIFSCQDSYFPGPTSDLHLRIFRPSSAKNLPAIIYFHGGGWVVNFVTAYDAALIRLANQSGAVIIAVNYQKAPEHPFPTPFDDCYATLIWASQNTQSLGIDPNNIGVAGDSAGGNLAAAVALKARDEQSVDLAFQLLVYPCIDRNFQTRSYIENADGFGLTTAVMAWFWEQYLQGEDHNTNPYACPGQAKDFKGLAPAIFVTAQYDCLTSDSEKYSEALKNDGVEVFYRQYPGMIHSFFANLAITPKSIEAIDYVGDLLKKIKR